jgi:hypothetical protein
VRPGQRSERTGASFFARALVYTILGAALVMQGCASGSSSSKKKTILLDTVYNDQDLGKEVSKEIEAEMGLYHSPGLEE